MLPFLVFNSGDLYYTWGIKNNNNNNGLEGAKVRHAFTCDVINRWNHLDQRVVDASSINALKDG